MIDKTARDAELHTRIASCNCTGDDGMQLHLSRGTVAFLIALLDRNNKLMWEGQDKQTIDLIEKFGRILAADIKCAFLTGSIIERMDESKFDRIKQEKEVKRDVAEDADIIMAVGPEALMALVENLMKSQLDVN